MVQECNLVQLYSACWVTFEFCCISVDLSVHLWAGDEWNVQLWNSIILSLIGTWHHPCYEESMVVLSFLVMKIFMNFLSVLLKQCLFLLWLTWSLNWIFVNMICLSVLFSFKIYLGLFILCHFEILFSFGQKYFG